ncbi:hypothetical protein ZEAMMB73_Zm00001d005738 [Zea mays]|uniref:Uncharacterized protein n=1 Tax=Zea mays TaxID=4577 RepID=A0A1D6EPT2_MAIZE|nr:hypothetical protein ZEAMMB73_Zm00001d005738 [Zea mays]
MSRDTRPQPTPPPGSLDARTQTAVVPMASWLLLPFSFFSWPAPPPSGYSSCHSSGSDGGRDNDYWRPTVVAAFAGAQVGHALRRRFADLLPLTVAPILWYIYCLTPFLLLSMKRLCRSGSITSKASYVGSQVMTIICNERSTV